MQDQVIINWLCISAVLSWICLIGLFIWIRMRNREKGQADVSRLVYLGKDMRPLAELGLSGRTSVVIGRNTTRQSVDLDLSQADGAGEVEEEHAVLNYAGGVWYLESLSTTNRVGIRKEGNSIVYRLKAMTPYKISAGDIIFISHEKIAVL